MARTIRQLLGDGDRTQVELNLNPPDLQATNVSAGNYSIARPQTPTKTTADQLFDAFKQVPGLINDAKTISEEVGQTEALAMDLKNEEDYLNAIAETEPDTFLTFGRNQAKKEILTKRYLNAEIVPVLESELKEDIDFNKYDTSEKYEAFIENRINEQWSAFSQALGSDKASSSTSKALWNSIYDGHRASLTLSYEAKEKEFIENSRVSEFGEVLHTLNKPKVDGTTKTLIPFETSGLQAAAQSFAETIVGDGHTDEEINDIVRKGFNAEIQLLISKGRVEDARAMYHAVTAIQIDNKDIYGSTNGKVSLKPVLDALTAAEETAETKIDQEDEKAYDDKVEMTTNSVVGSIRYLKGKTSIEELSDNREGELERIFRQFAPNETDEQIKTRVSNLFTQDGLSPEQALNEALFELSVESDDNRLLYSKIQPKLETRLERVNVEKLQGSNISPKRAKALAEEYEAYHRLNPGSTPEDFYADEHPNYKNIGAVNDKHKELSKGAWVEDREDYKLSSISSSVADLTLAEMQEQDEDFKRTDLVSSAVVRENMSKAIQYGLRDWARTYEPGDKTQEQISKDYDAKRAELIETQVSSLMLPTIAQPQQDIQPMTEEEEKDLENTKTPKKSNYASLNPYRAKEFARDQDNQTIPEDKLKVIQADRQKMQNNNHYEPYRLSLARHGFNSYDAKNAQILKDYNMDTEDVRLFGTTAELNQITAEMGYAIVLAGASKDFIDSNPEMKEIAGIVGDRGNQLREEAANLGILSMEDLKQFIIAQESFFGIDE